MWKIELLPLAVLVCPLQKSVSASGFGYKRLIFRQRILRFPLADLGCRLTGVRGFGLQALCFPLADLLQQFSISGFGQKAADTVFSVSGFGKQAADTVFFVSGLGRQTTRFSVAYNCFALADLDCRPLVFV